MLQNLQMYWDYAKIACMPAAPNYLDHLLQLFFVCFDIPHSQGVFAVQWPPGSTQGWRGAFCQLGPRRAPGSQGQFFFLLDGERSQSERVRGCLVIHEAGDSCALTRPANGPGPAPAKDRNSGSASPRKAGSASRRRAVSMS